MFVCVLQVRVAVAAVETLGKLGRTFSLSHSRRTLHKWWGMQRDDDGGDGRGRQRTRTRTRFWRSRTKRRRRCKSFVFRKLFTLRRIHNNWLCRAQANGKPTPTPAPATAPTATQQRSGSASVWRRPNNKRTNTHRTRIEQRRQHSALCIQRTPNTTRATTCCVEPAAAAKQRELNINNYVI